MRTHIQEYEDTYKGVPMLERQAKRGKREGEKDRQTKRGEKRGGKNGAPK